MNLYHGTNSNPIDVVQSPSIVNAVNGIGFFMTNDMTIAKRFGRYIIEVESDIVANIVRPYDSAYEHIFTTQSRLNDFMFDSPRIRVYDTTLNFCTEL